MKREPNPFVLFDTLKTSGYNAVNKKEFSKETTNFARSLFGEYKAVSGLLYAFVAKYAKNENAANMATYILLNERNMNPAYAFKIAKTLKSFYLKHSSINRKTYNLMSVIEQQSIA